MDESRRTSGRIRLRLLLGVAVLSIAGAVWGVSQIQRSAADRAFAASHAAHQMLTAMVDQETGLRGYVLTQKQEEFLEPYVRGRQDFDAAVRSARRNVDSSGRDELGEQVAAARRWQASAGNELARLRATKRPALDLPAIRMRKDVFDSYRKANASFQATVSAARVSDNDEAELISIAVILAVGLLFAGVGYFVIERQAASQRRTRIRVRAYREAQAEFNETMQIMRDEEEAHALVKQHLERAIPEADVVVLSRNNSANRLSAATPLPSQSPIAAALLDAEPDTCLSVRLAREYRRGTGTDPLLRCDICGVAAREVTCVPSVVSGEVIGAVLIQHPKALDPEQRESVSDSVSQAAPVLANLRNLAVAEMRAATDALTGLPNQRACQDNLKRILALASRAVSPFSVVLLDLDHFKQVNDRYGHGVGDDVLAAVGNVLPSVLRASDFAGRYGGEEFLILMPDTDSEGALEAAEKLRAAIQAIDLPQVDRPITASLGVASYPTDALESDTLVRMADRALYSAKGAGRNRVELAMPSSGAADLAELSSS